MKKFIRALFAAMTIALAMSCVSTKSVVIPIEKIPQMQARTQIVRPLLENLRDFGNVMARYMLSDYRIHSIEETANGACLYRFDASNPKLPKHAYIVFRLEGAPSISTNVGAKNYILLDGGSIGLVPADEPAKVSAGGFTLKYTTSGFREGFNPYVIGNKGDYPEQLLLWFKDPATKDQKMRELASLLLSAFPRLRYKTK